MINRFGLAVALALLLGSSSTAPAQSLPDYMGPISGKTSSTPADVATKDVLALNTGMFELYGDAARIFQKNILDKHPVILGLFSGAGGRLILYRPGKPPTEAPQRCCTKILGCCAWSACKGRPASMVWSVFPRKPFSTYWRSLSPNAPPRHSVTSRA